MQEFLALKPFCLTGGGMESLLHAGYCYTVLGDLTRKVVGANVSKTSKGWCLGNCGTSVKVKICDTCRARYSS
jgi:hypothetical protein